MKLGPKSRFCCCKNCIKNTNLQIFDCVFDSIKKIKVVDKIRWRLWFKVESDKEQDRLSDIMFYTKTIQGSQNVDLQQKFPRNKIAKIVEYLFHVH